MGEPKTTQTLPAALGKHEAGEGCLYVTRLSDVDVAPTSVLKRDLPAWLGVVERDRSRTDTAPGESRTPGIWRWEPSSRRGTAAPEGRRCRGCQSVSSDRSVGRSTRTRAAGSALACRDAAAGVEPVGCVRVLPCAPRPLSAGPAHRRPWRSGRHRPALRRGGESERPPPRAGDGRGARERWCEPPLPAHSCPRRLTDLLSCPILRPIERAARVVSGLSPGGFRHVTS